MKKLLLALVALLTLAPGINALDPVKPDMDSIRAAVLNPESPFYYPALMKRYESRDTTMGLEDYRHLYLGAIYEEDFTPYRRGQFSDLVEQLYYKSIHTKSECDNIINYAQKALNDNPFDLQQIDYLIYALREKKKTNTANIWQYRLNHILEAIVSTGTGMDTLNAWYVISPQHEYFLLNHMGRVATDYNFQAPWYDVITVAPGEKSKKAEKYYFNSRYFLQEYRMKYPTDDDDDDESADSDADQASEATEVTEDEAPVD